SEEEVTREEMRLHYLDWGAPVAHLSHVFLSLSSKRGRGQPDPRYWFLLEHRNCSSQSRPGRVPNSFPKPDFPLPETSLRSGCPVFSQGQKQRHTDWRRVDHLSRGPFLP